MRSERVCTYFTLCTGAIHTTRGTKNLCICCWNSHETPACRSSFRDHRKIVTPPEFSRTPIASLLTAASAATGGRGSRMKAPTYFRLQIVMNSFGRTNIAAVFPSPSALSSLRMPLTALIRNHPESQTGSHCLAGNTAGFVEFNFARIRCLIRPHSQSAAFKTRR